MKRIRKHLLSNGETKLEPIDLRRKMCLNYLEYSNTTHACGKFDLPELLCSTTIFPDYIALYNEPGQYHRTPLTAVGFWQFDNVFDGIDGIYNAIYYSDKKLLKYYRQRFAGVHLFFTPDYSQFGDVDLIEQLMRLKKARIVGLWFALELHAVVIPFITVPTVATLDYALNGLEHCHVVAFSTKGYVRNLEERNSLKEIIRRTVDTLELDAIVVYDVCKDNRAINDIFSYAKQRDIEIIVPMNTLKLRNMTRAEERSKRERY